MEETPPNQRSVSRIEQTNVVQSMVIIHPLTL